ILWPMLALRGLARDAGEQITLLGVIPVTAESYVPYGVALSVVAQLILMPIVGAIADTAKSKKSIMGLFAYIGAFAVMGMFFLDGTNYQLGGVLFIVANAAFGAALVVYNSFLPEIATPDERDGVSSRAWAMGYAGGIILLVANLVLFLGHESFGITEGMAVRLALFSAGAWWALFTLIPLARLRNRPNRLAAEVTDGGGRRGVGIRQLAHTMRDLRRYPVALLFVIAFFFYNDGIQTVIALSATYADQELGLETTIIIVAVLIVQTVGIAGALLLGRAARRFTAKKVVLFSLILWTLVLVVAFLLPAGSSLPFLFLAAFIGFVLGGSQALSRSLFAQLVPRDREAEYFSFYEISGSASSLLGPLIFGLPLQFLGSYRVAILALVVFFIIGGILLSRVDMKQGMRDVEAGGRSDPRDATLSE
ncbi:MAG: MFS transporter, partial [Candidatus Nanopelagicales bacterium]